MIASASENFQSFTWILLLLATLLGLIFGWGGTLLVDRVPSKKRLWTRSKNSFKRSPHHPIIELATASLFLASVFIFQNWIDLLLWLVLVIFGIPLAVIDLTMHRLPDLLTGALFVCSAAIILGDAFHRHHFNRIIPGVIGALALPAFYIALMIISRGGMGMGDVKLSAGIGLVSGFFGLHTLLVGSFATYLFGSIISIALMILGKAGRKTPIPFGPFMLVGQAIALIYAAQPISFR